ncbi:MAG: hypothetical protein GF353_28720 [Candidatus Lokiarchaeota archaeon]|nr:hypothetical protein [Candidatus Lokiarchaeota archaeon]MBD3353986.1 hypothetical protein [Candidatus Lokiarchaeota archaeon]
MSNNLLFDGLDDLEEIEQESQADHKPIQRKKTKSKKTKKTKNKRSKKATKNSKLESKVKDMEKKLDTLLKQFKQHIKKSDELETIPVELINDFIDYIRGLDITKFPTQRSIIQQVQKYNKNATILYVMQLWRKFMKIRK